MENDQLPEDSEISEEEEVQTPPTLSSGPAEELRLAHERAAHGREDALFKFACQMIKWLAVFGCVAVISVICAVAKGASPWLITLGSICMILPAVLAGYLFQHTFQSRSQEQRAENQLIEHAPVVELVKNLSDWLQSLIKSRS